jgi:hypothetical protein
MGLARDLLRLRETDVVVDYFDLCAKFWTRGEERLKDWTAEVSVAKMPNFGANLAYYYFHPAEGRCMSNGYRRAPDSEHH